MSSSSSSSYDSTISSSDLALKLSKCFVCKAYGILGFPKLTNGYYILLITKKTLVGNILNENIYTIKDYCLEHIPSSVFTLY